MSCLATLIPSSTLIPPLPCNKTYSQVLDIRTWDILEEWGMGGRVLILLTPVADCVVGWLEVIWKSWGFYFLIY